MPRQSKSTKKSKKEDDEEEIIYDDISEDDTKKKSKAKPKPKAKKSKKPDDEDEENLLSDLEMDEDEAGTKSIETGEKDAVVMSKKPQSTRKKVDPATPLNETNIIDGLYYYVDVASDPNNPNPTLKYGLLNLIRKMRGQKPRRKKFYGANNGNNNSNHHSRNSKPGFHTRSSGSKTTRTTSSRTTKTRPSSFNEEIYDDSN